MRSEERHKIREKSRWSKWYPKKNDSTIIGYWADACSEKNNHCLDCLFLEECQDLIDRLTDSMEVTKRALFYRS